jgi:hypothetical protein
LLLRRSASCSECASAFAAIADCQRQCMEGSTSPDGVSSRDCGVGTGENGRIGPNRQAGIVRYPAGRTAVDEDAGIAEAPTGDRYTPPVAEMGALPTVAADHVVPFGNLILDGVRDVREAARKALKPCRIAASPCHSRPGSWTKASGVKSAPSAQGSLRVITANRRGATATQRHPPSTQLQPARPRCNWVLARKSGGALGSTVVDARGCHRAGSGKEQGLCSIRPACPPPRSRPTVRRQRRQRRRAKPQPRQ